MIIRTLLAIFIIFICRAVPASTEDTLYHKLALTPVDFSQLPGWRDHDPRPSFAAFRQSCRKILDLRQPNLPVNRNGWLKSCRKAMNLQSENSTHIQQFFQRNFTPYTVSNNRQGLFTGYYIPLAPVSRHPDAEHSAPLLTRPDKNFLVRYTRQQINHGALRGKTEVLAYADPVDRFFLQIQGSGMIRFSDGQTVKIGFAGKNGKSYTSIGKLLVKQGVFTPETVSLQTLRRWMKKHPTQAQQLMNRNASFVFFKKLPDDDIIGSQGVPLTAGYSLAVDKTLIPMGLPIWLSTHHPDPMTPDTQQPFQRLMVAQDTGSAIRGVVRGDVYWGAGKQAEIIAGHMRSRGRWWLLLPNSTRQSTGSPSYQ